MNYGQIKNMSEKEYIYTDVSCPRCKTKRGITLSNGVAGCSICGSEVAKAKKHVSVKMSDTIKISDNIKAVKN